MTAPTQTAGPGARTTYTPPVPVPQPTDVTRVLVVGHGDGRRVRWALTQVWRRAGRPLSIRCGASLTVGVEAWLWHQEHDVAGNLVAAADDPEPFDVLLTFGHERHLSAELRAALPLARRAGLVVDGDTVPEFR